MPELVGGQIERLTEIAMKLYGLVAAALVLLGNGSSRAAAPDVDDAPRVQVQTVSTTVNANNNWRYRWHGNQWWYWTPRNTWVVYSGGRWVPPAYRAPVYRYPNRYYGYYRPYNPGFYGPSLRYGTSFGYYPYSRWGYGLYPYNTWGYGWGRSPYWGGFGGYPYYGRGFSIGFGF